MLGLESQYRLRDFFQKLGTLELGIEKQRQKLAREGEFEPYASFCRVNRRCNKQIGASEINNFLK